MHLFMAICCRQCDRTIAQPIGTSSTAQNILCNVQDQKITQFSGALGDLGFKSGGCILKGQPSPRAFYSALLFLPSLTCPHMPVACAHSLMMGGDVSEGGES